MRSHPAFLAVLLLVSTPIAARAGDDPDAPSPQRAAAASSEEGLRHFNAGRWAEADEAFRKAEALFHAPTLVLYRAHCQKRLGKLAAALALYRRVAAEQLPKDAPVPFLTAQGVAREEIDGLRHRVAVLRLTAGGALPAGAVVTVDGEAVGPPPLSLEVDAGEHVVGATVAGSEPFRRSIALKEGASGEVPVALAPPVAGAPAVASSPNIERAAGPRGPITSALIAFGGGAAFAGVGAITGAIALARAGSIRNRCSPDGRCSASDVSGAASTGRLADASTASFVLAGAAIAAGVVLLVVRPGGGESAGKSAAIEVLAGPGWAGARGRF